MTFCFVKFNKVFPHQTHHTVAYYYHQLCVGAYNKGDEKYMEGKESTFLAENFAHAAEKILTAKK